MNPAFEFTIGGFGFAQHGLNAEQKETIRRIARRLISGDGVPRLSAIDRLHVIGHATGTRNLEDHAKKRATSVLGELRSSCSLFGATSGEVNKITLGTPVTRKVSSASQSPASDRKVVLAVRAPAPPPPPPRTTCRTFVPSAANTLVAGQREFAAPRGLTVVNWSNAGEVHHFTHPRTATCRAGRNVTELILHETVSAGFSLSFQRDVLDARRHVGPQFALHRDGTVSQHNDLVDRLDHAVPHNDRSVGIEVVNPVVPRVAPRGFRKLPDAWPFIGRTAWANRDAGGKPRTVRNEHRTYILPTRGQMESLALLVGWLTDDTVGHGLAIPRTWLGIDPRNRMAFGSTGRHRGAAPGIYAHGYFAHNDGFFQVLYVWLRLEANGGRGLRAVDAYDRAVEIATREVRRVSGSGLRADLSADL